MSRDHVCRVISKDIEVAVQEVRCRILVDRVHCGLRPDLIEQSDGTSDHGLGFLCGSVILGSSDGRRKNQRHTHHAEST